MFKILHLPTGDYVGISDCCSFYKYINEIKIPHLEAWSKLCRFGPNKKKENSPFFDFMPLTFDDYGCAADCLSLLIQTSTETDITVTSGLYEYRIKFPLNLSIAEFEIVEEIKYVKNIVPNISYSF